MAKDKECVEPVFSVVVPVYNAEQYLKRTLKSILDQNFTEFELILVNDGSSDRSLAVCEAVALTDARVLVLNSEKNYGAAEARNRGINKAKGKYLCFVDADDYIERDFLSHFYDVLQKDDYDYIKCGAYEEYFDTNENVQYRRSCVLPDQTFQEVKTIIDQVIDMELIPLFGYNWNSCYKMAIVQEKKLWFDRTLKVHEDFAFNMAYLPFVKKMCCLSYCGYHYIKRNNSSLTFQKENYKYDIQLLKIRSFLSLLKKNRNETQENLDKIYWMFTRYTLSALESGLSMEIVREEPVFDAYKKHCFGPLEFKKKVLTGLLQSENELMLKLTICLMGFVKHYLPVVFAKVKK